MSSTPDPSPAPEPLEPAADTEHRGRASRTSSTRAQVVAAVLLCALGFAMSTQVRQENDRDDFTGARQSDLVTLIDSISLATRRTQAEVADLRRTRDSLLDDTASRRTALGLARSQATTLGILAGTLPAVGPGIRVTVEAESGDLGTDQMLNALQELRDAGAEAVEINDSVRVVAQTAITDSRSGLVVGGKRLSAPYVIDAIGDPHTLATALDFEGGFKPEVEQTGGTVDIKQADSVEVGSTVRLPQMRFAAPDTQE